MDKPKIMDWQNPKYSRENRIKKNKRGIWQYNAETHCIECQKVVEGHKFWYEVDLERCKNSAQLLDWIFQVEGKSWINSKDLGDLCRCIDTIVDVQSQYCSMGVDHAVDIKKYLKTKVDPLLQK